jgi:hypothetical protein
MKLIGLDSDFARGRLWNARMVKKIGPQNIDLGAFGIILTAKKISIFLGIIEKS